MTRHTPYFLLIIALYLVLGTGMVFTQATWCDESWQASPAFDLLNGGTMGMTGIDTSEKVHQGMDRHSYWMPPVHYLSQAGWCRVFGEGLFQVRFHSMFWGIVLLMSVYSLLKSTYVRWVGLLAMLILAVDFNFVFCAAENRPDVMSAALVFAGYAVFMRFRQSSLTWAMVGGHTLVCLSGMTHPNAIIGLAGLVFLNIYFDRKRLSLRTCLLACIPYVLGIIGWGWWIMLAPQDFLAQVGGNMNGRLSNLLAPLTSIRREAVERYGELYGLRPGAPLYALPKAFVLVGYVAGVVGVLRYKFLKYHMVSRSILWLLLITVLIMTFLLCSKTIRYMVWVVPLTAILMAVGYWFHWRKFLAVGIILLVLLNISITGWRIHRDEYHGYYVPTVNYLQGIADEDDVIMGGSELWFGMGFDRVIDDKKLGLYSGIEPDIVVMGPQYRNYISDDPAGNNWVNYLDDEERVWFLAVLESLEVVWDDGYYQIYERVE